MLQRFDDDVPTREAAWLRTSSAHQYSVHVTSITPTAPLAWPWRDFARWSGSSAPCVSWFLFTFSFTTLYLTAFTVMSLGGFCASGGPYQIEVECPANVLAFTPWNIFGGLLAVVVSVLFAQGFGTPLVLWAWPILFTGLSVPFFYSAAYGAWGNAIVGVMFAVMGLGAVWIFFKGGGLRLGLLGSRNIHGNNFVGGDNTKPAYQLIGRRPGADVEPVDATAGDWMLALGVTLVAGGAGIWVAQLAWAAASAAG